ncbi:hypothetical protein DV735_g453, partial [Chaetothyriales sp. CBS 134920]
MDLSKSSISLFQSSDRLELLNDIDRFREHGLDNLPQIVVCGDTSSGKSSVLSALSGIPFPVSGTLCTRFATEIALRFSAAAESVTGHAFITPAAKHGPAAETDHGARDEGASKHFWRDITSLDDIPTLLDDARKAMGLGEKSGISRDVLHLKLVGNELPNLTLVDLPGLIHASSNADDIAMVQDLVEDYFRQERSIILVVVSAENPIQNQGILTFSCRFDPKGTRSIGVITKPDVLGQPDKVSLRPAMLELASNRNTACQFTRGWYVVRCLNDKERDDGLDRESLERALFEKELWKTSLGHRQLGIASLRSALTKYLHQHILQVLPELQTSLASRLNTVKSSLDMLGDSRTTQKEQMRYLTRISQRFGDLVKQALEGDYSDPFFQDGDDSKRLRAATMSLTDDYEVSMQTNGHSFEICEESEQTERSAHSPEQITHFQALVKVGKLLQSHRGPELSFLTNPRLVGELFKEQSQKWLVLTSEYLDEICAAVETFVGKAVEFICPLTGETSQLILRHVLDDALETYFQNLESKAEELFSPYTKSFLYSTRGRLYASLNEAGLNEAILKRAESEEVQQKEKDHGDKGSARKETTDIHFGLLQYSTAYYNVALETFIETVVIHGVESCLLSKLPAMFTPDTVLQMDNNLLDLVGGESADVQIEREELLKQLETLEDSLKRCQRHTSRFHRTKVAEEKVKQTDDSDASNSPSAPLSSSKATLSSSATPTSASGPSASTTTTAVARPIAVAISHKERKLKNTPKCFCVDFRSTSSGYWFVCDTGSGSSSSKGTFAFWGSHSPDFQFCIWISSHNSGSSKGTFAFWHSPNFQFCVWISGHDSGGSKGTFAFWHSPNFQFCVWIDDVYEWGSSYVQTGNSTLSSSYSQPAPQATNE